MPIITLKSGTYFTSNSDISILDAGLSSEVHLPYSCRTGRCSSCKCKVIRGDTKLLFTELGLTDKEKFEGWILSCARSATTDVTLEVEDLGGVTIPRASTQVCRIASLSKLTPNILKVILRLPPGIIFDYIPGQYIDIIGPGGVRRSYSLANAPKSDNTLELHIRGLHNGVMSDYWFNRSKVNDLLRLHGPHGTFFLRNIAKRDLIFLATGTGIAPIKAMLETLPSLPTNQQPRSITVLWGARHEKDLYFEASALSRFQKYIPVLSKADATWRGERGYVQDELLRQVSDFRCAVVYACGSDSMIHSAKFKLTAAGLHSQHFYSDAFVCSGTIAP